MNNLGKISTLFTILLLIFCFHTIRAERTELTTALPDTPLEKSWNDDVDPGLSVEAGGSLSSIMRLVYSDLDLPKMEHTWSRLVRETIALNEDLVANPNPTALHDPAANRVEPGTLLRLPAIVAVEEGDTGIGRVLIRLNPKLKGNGHALIGAIKATITANADLIRKADVNQLRDGRFNVIIVGDVLVLPPEVKPYTPAGYQVQPNTMVAEKPAAPKTALPSTDETVEETVEKVTAVVETEPDQTEETNPAGEEKPVEIADQVAAIVLPEPEQTEETDPAGEEKPVETVELVAAVVEPEPEQTAETAPAGEEKPVETTELVAAVVEPEPQQTEVTALNAEPFPAITADLFDGPIGLTAWETRRPAKPVKKSGILAGNHLLLAYLLAGLALFGLFIIMIVRWLERDRVFREQFNLLFGAAVFLVTLGRVRIKPLVEVTAEEKDRLAIPDPSGKQET